MVEDRHEHPFYDVDIIRREEQAYITKLLKRYRNEPVTDALRKAVWDLLMEEKHLGRIKIPFKVLMKQDPTGKFPDSIEVILDSKV